MNLNKRFFIILTLSACLQLPVFLSIIYYVNFRPDFINLGVRFAGYENNNPFARYVMPLEKIDYEAYLKCKKMENSKIFKSNIPEDVRYYVVTNPNELLAQQPFLKIYAAWTIPDSWPIIRNGRMRREVYFWPWTINAPDFQKSTAHELGHIVGSTIDEVVADRIGAKILNESRFASR